ncbi:MAG: Crp/Fnr family transcriptional regulator [Anaerolineae bacterium]|nr:Crp/Fnr family transcriptional regulator [Anaerolineae bacterium]
MSQPPFFDFDRSNSFIRSVPFFHALDDAALRDVAAECIERRYRTGEIIFLEGELNAGLHLVVDGHCKVYRLSEEGREHVITPLGPGDSCNEVSIVDGGPNPANLVALDDATLWIISTDALDRLRRKHAALNDMIIKILATRCRHLLQRVYNLSFLSVTGRLAAFLLEQTGDDNKLSRRTWTQDEIAAHLGTVRETVTRAFKELQQARLIEMTRHRIEIVDREGLKNWV